MESYELVNKSMVSVYVYGTYVMIGSLLDREEFRTAVNEPLATPFRSTAAVYVGVKVRERVYSHVHVSARVCV